MTPAQRRRHALERAAARGRAITAGRLQAALRRAVAAACAGCDRRPLYVRALEARAAEQRARKSA